MRHRAADGCASGGPRLVPLLRCEYTSCEYTCESLRVNTLRVNTLRVNTPAPECDTLQHHNRRGSALALCSGFRAPRANTGRPPKITVSSRLWSGRRAAASLSLSLSLSLSRSRGLESTPRLLESPNTRGVSGRQRSTRPLQECRLDSTEAPLILLLGPPSSHGDSARVPWPKSRTSICAAW